MDQRGKSNSKRIRDEEILLVPPCWVFRENFSRQKHPKVRERAWLCYCHRVGGGITRDVLIQKGPPLAFLDVRYLPDALGAGIQPGPMGVLQR